MPIGLAKMATIVEFDEYQKKKSLLSDGGAGQCAIPGTVFGAVFSRTALSGARSGAGKSAAAAAGFCRRLEARALEKKCVHGFLPRCHALRWDHSFFAP